MTLTLKNKSSERLRSTIAYIFVAGFCLGLIFWLTRGQTDLTIPIAKDGDTVWSASAIKNFINGGDKYFFPYWGAPFEVYRYASPISPYLITGLIKLVTLFTNSYGLVLNIVSFMVYPLTGVVALFALRRFNISRLIACACAIVYATLPYAFLRFQGHLYLSFYFLIPLVCVCALWIMRGDVINAGEFVPKNKLSGFFGNIDRKKLLFCIITGLLIGLCDSYYAVFAMIILMYAGIFAWVKQKNYKYFTVALIAILCVIATTSIWIIISKSTDSLSHLADTRSVGHVEHYSLKLTNLVFPNRYNRVEELANFTQYYLANTPVNNEGIDANLGFFATVGFIYSLFIALFKKFSSKDENIEYCGKINLFILIFAGVGGICSVLNFLVPAASLIRCYNRMSVIVAFLSLLAVAFLLMRIRLKITRKLSLAVFSLVLAVCTGLSLYTQIPLFDFYGINKISNDNYINNKNYFSEVENTMPEDAMLLQLPHISSEVFTNVGRQPGIYEWQFPYLYTDNVKISLGTPAGSFEELWMENLSDMPVEEMLQTASVVGFDGILIDRLAYQEGGPYVELEAQLQSTLNQDPLVSFNERYAFFNIGEYKDKYLSQYSKKDLESIKADLLEGVFVNIVTGSNGLEYNKNIGEYFQWMADEASMEFINTRGEPTKMLLEFDVVSHSGDFYNLDILYEKKIYSYKVNAQSQKISLSLVVPQGKSTLEIFTDIPKIDNSIDIRNLRYTLSNLKLTEATLT